MLQEEQLKSPKPEQSLKADWQILIDEALGDELANDDDLDPKIINSQKAEETRNYNKSIYINS